MAHPERMSEERLGDHKRIGGSVLVDDLVTATNFKEVTAELIAERARYDEVQKNALDFLASSMCMEHASMAKKQTFQQFFEENHGKCLPCHVARAERAESELQELREVVSREAAMHAKSLPIPSQRKRHQIRCPICKAGGESDAG